MSNKCEAGALRRRWFWCDFAFDLLLFLDLTSLPQNQGSLILKSQLQSARQECPPHTLLSDLRYNPPQQRS
jgi:hypothetical protein